MLEWVKSTVKDMRKGKAVRRKARTRLEEERAEKKAKAYLEAERARLMAKSEKELLVETLMTLRSWESRYEDLKAALRLWSGTWRKWRKGFWTWNSALPVWTPTRWIRNRRAAGLRRGNPDADPLPAFRPCILLR